MANAEKVAAVAEIAEKFSKSTATVVTEYRGLSVGSITELRRSLGAGTTYSVAKNTLVKRAAADAGVEGLDELFEGPTAIAFIEGEPVEAAKAIKKFAKDNKALVIKGGYMDGKALSVAEVERIADLESREVLLAKLAGAMKGNLAKAAGLFNAPASQVPAWPSRCRRRRPPKRLPRKTADPANPRAHRSREPSPPCLADQRARLNGRTPPWRSSPPKSCLMLSRS